MYELAVQRSEAPIIFSCRFRHGSNPSIRFQLNNKLNPEDFNDLMNYLDCKKK